MLHLWEVLDFVADGELLDKTDKANLQATCRALRNAGIASEVANKSIHVEGVSPDNFESFSLWLQPRAAGIKDLLGL